MLLTSLILASTTVTSTFARAFAVPDPAAVNAAINPSGILDFEPVESVLLNTSIPLEAIDAEYRKRNVERDVYGNQLKRDLAAMEAAHEKHPNQHLKRATTQGRTPRTTSAAKCRVVSKSCAASSSPSPSASSSSVRSSSITPTATSTTPQARQSPLTATTAPASYSTSTSLPPLGFNYGTAKVRGVNLGGWLVLEAFIKPSMLLGPYQKNNLVVDEWTLCQYGDYNTVFNSLSNHWATWITEDDFAQMAAAGLNHVRIPVGFWAIDVSGGEPYIQGSLYWLHQAITWAGRHNLKVMIDLHGVPGSQNGFDNSGRRGNVLWHTAQSNVLRSQNVIQALTTEFTKLQYNGVVTSIQPVNEPAGYIQGVVEVTKPYYQNTYQIVRGGSTPSNLLFTIHDAFMGLPYWQGFLNYMQGFQYVALDTHIYSMFTDQAIAYTDAQRTKAWCDMAPSIQSSNNNLWTLVGEWTVATTDCAGKIPGLKYSANGPSDSIGGGSRYDGTAGGSSRYIGDCSTRSGSGATFSNDYKITLRKFYELQTSIYENSGSGWLMWTWKMESADDWSYQGGLKYGWIPFNPSEKLYGNQC